mmetsp:Transcript_145743/g.353858  ORF Transcript_145743/g.353858 Transcript_145743/m.353858 type:complete len:276 (-) Transcript_145743:197-1024(-)
MSRGAALPHFCFFAENSFHDTVIGILHVTKNRRDLSHILCEERRLQVFFSCPLRLFAACIILFVAFLIAVRATLAIAHRSVFVWSWATRWGRALKLVLQNTQRVNLCLTLGLRHLSQPLRLCFFRQPLLLRFFRQLLRLCQLLCRLTLSLCLQGDLFHLDFRVFVAPLGVFHNSIVLVFTLTRPGYWRCSSSRKEISERISGLFLAVCGRRAIVRFRRGERFCLSCSFCLLLLLLPLCRQFDGFLRFPFLFVFDLLLRRKRRKALPFRSFRILLV